jgi:hypothetical protein
VTPWDGAKAGAIAKQLVTATQELYDSFYKQPTPTVGTGQARAYQRLKQNVRRLQIEARELSGAIEKGEGQEQTLPIYEDLMQLVRDAREDARQVFTTAPVAEKAAAARGLLNQLGPYYDPDFEALEPTAR